MNISANHQGINSILSASLCLRYIASPIILCGSEWGQSITSPFLGTEYHVPFFKNVNYLYEAKRRLRFFKARESFKNTQ